MLDFSVALRERAHPSLRTGNSETSPRSHTLCHGLRSCVHAPREQAGVPGRSVLTEDGET